MEPLIHQTPLAALRRFAIGAFIGRGGKAAPRFAGRGREGIETLRPNAGFTLGASVIILRPSRRLYGGWTLQGASPPPSRRDPSPDLVPRPPSPHGRGENSSRDAARPTPHLPSPRGEGGPRHAFSPAGAGQVRGLFPVTQSLLQKMSNSYCLPGRAGGYPNALASLRPRHSSLVPGFQ